MLVLLVVFMMTIPVVTQTIPMNLPQVSAMPTEQSNDALQLSINAHGFLFLDDQPMDEVSLAIKLSEASQKNPDTSLYLHADRTLSYEKITKILLLIQTNGLSNIGFMTEAP
jgi:biopolymer transport protein ExbD